jgi:citrate lyase subunit beta/citryl-CoA lyase
MTIAPLRPRRSVLYMPASNLKAISKARTLPCDAVVLDLEDAVAPEMKAEARAQAVGSVHEGGFGARELIIRVNGLDTEWGRADLEAAVAASPDAVLVPKVSSASDLAAYERALDGARPGVALWCMVETARALFRLEEIAAASAGSRLTAFVMGTNDLAKEIGWELDAARVPFLAALSLAVAAAKAHGLLALDGVYNGLEDPEGFEAQCRQARAFGFDGKTLIHPNQVETANAVFSPTAEQLAYARQVIAAFRQPENAGRGAIRVNGKMAERLHLTQSERLVAVADTIAQAQGAAG